MVANRPRGDDDLTELPWASVFDPAANARALSAIQAEGFRAASRVVDRFAQIAGNVSGGPRQATDAGAPEAAAPLTPGLNPDVDLVITTWWTVLPIRRRYSSQSINFGQWPRRRRRGHGHRGGACGSIPARPL
jgi:hypothetical protein